MCVRTRTQWYTAHLERQHAQKTVSPPLDSYSVEESEPEEGEVSSATPWMQVGIPPETEKANGMAAEGQAIAQPARALATICGPTQASRAAHVEKSSRGTKPHLKRNPPKVPVFQPYFRYCTRCEMLKPLRAHHCRHSGTCVLKL
jgi:hypothetical protein